MTYKIEKTKTGVKIKVEVGADAWNGYVEKAYNAEKGKYNVQGFRKGHAPRKMIERMYGASVFLDAAFNFCFKTDYGKILDENADLYPVEEPKIDFESIDDKGIKYSIEFAVKPIPVLGEYTDLTINKIEYTVAKKDIDKEVEAARTRLSRKAEKEDGAAAEDGDTVTLDYSGSVDGVKFDGGTAEKQELTLGSKSFIPGFEEQMLGMKKGESRDLKVSFPEQYHSADLAGKAAVFAVTVHNIFKNELPPIDDALAKEVSQFDTLKEWKDDIEKRLKTEAERKTKVENENALVDKIVAGSKVDIPPSMVESELQYMLNDFAMQLQYMYGGMKIDDYFKATGTSAEDYKNDHKLKAEKNVKTRLILEEIIKAEKLEITDADYDAEIEKRAEQSKKTKDEFLKTVDEGFSNYIKSTLISEKLIGYLVANNKIEKKVTKK